MKHLQTGYDFPIRLLRRAVVHGARIRTLAALAALAVSAAGLSGCARVHQKDREYLSDPILRLYPDELGHSLETHNLPRREGAAGGASGSGGGCGC